VAETGIAWPVDLEKKYGAQGAAHFNDVPALRGGAAVAGPLNGDEHLAVWMRTAALPAFRKLWGRVLQDLPAGALVTVTVANRRAPRPALVRAWLWPPQRSGEPTRARARARRYNTYRFGGAKRVVLSTAGWLGGRNTFLGAAYLAVGGASLLSAASFFLLAWRLPRRLGDPALLSWHDAGADGGGA